MFQNEENDQTAEMKNDNIPRPADKKSGGQRIQAYNSDYRRWAMSKEVPKHRASGGSNLGGQNFFHGRSGGSRGCLTAILVFFVLFLLFAALLAFLKSNNYTAFEGIMNFLGA